MTPARRATVRGAGGSTGNFLPFVLLCVVSCVVSGCATPTTLHAPIAAEHVVVDGKDAGAVAAGGDVHVDVAPGGAPVAWQLLDAKNVELSHGELPRTEVRWEIVAPAVAGAACCVPTLAAAGCCVANPALLGGAVGCLLAGNIGGVFAAMQAPGWLTIPLGCAGAASGASPLALGMIGIAPPASAALEPAASSAAPEEPLPSSSSSLPTAPAVAEVLW